MARGIVAASILFSIASVSSPATAAVDVPHLFDRAACQRFLATPAEVQESARDRAAEIFAWFTLRHPGLDRFLELTDDSRFACHLLLLNSGYSIPPSPTKFLQAHFKGGLEPEHRFKSNVHFWNDRHLACNERGVRALRQAVLRIARGQATDEEKGHFLSFFLNRASRALLALTQDEDAQRLPDFNVVSTESYLGYMTGFSADLNTKTTPAQMAVLARLVESLGDPSVQRALATLVFENLPRLIEDHAAIFDGLVGIYDVQGVRFAIRLLRNKPSGIAGLPSAGFRVLNAPAEMIAAESSSASPSADEGPEPAPSNSSPLGPVTINSFVDLRPQDIHRKLREYSARLSHLIVRIRGGGSAPSHVDWARDLSETPRAIRTLEDRVRAAAAERDAELSSVSERHRELRDSEEWLRNLITQMTALKLEDHGDEIAKLPPHERTLLSSIVRLLPALENMTALALASSEARRTDLAERIDHLGQIMLLTANHLGTVTGVLGANGGGESLRLLKEALAATVDREGSGE